LAVPLDEPGATVEVRMAWRKNETSCAVLSFLDSMRAFFRAKSSAGSGKTGQAGKRRARLVRSR
jgi:hypothetical protein